MSFTLTMSFDEGQFEYKEKVYTVDMAFDNILLFLEMFDEKELEFVEKIFLGLQLLINEYDELNFESLEEAYEMFKYVLREFLGFDLDEKNEDGETQIKTYDYSKDAELIYASFFAVYKLDLFDLKGQLHWRKFQALLNNLDDNSPFKQVIGYRVMKVPSEKEASRDYISHVRKMKEIYSLEDGPRDVTSVFDSLANSFKTQAKGVKDNG
ncbi:Gp15 family bacteriophage protein [Cytobacillus oceanisediminis]|uniref:Gp15 family bacteriophage protein n=1 Tax=Cytobacillus oceanisediminis TaxID=665099 RepID=UPI001C239D80|nr:Gp15 family bacteriophage protein [Cytobacillus oceanisediminis]MBU8773183.1 bacteriophage Gp15 family protein [Cytobacillus oceanisediminis]